MALFDDIDARTAAAVGRVLEDPVIWRPMLPGGGGDFVVIPGGRPDPNRPVRGELGDLPAIVTWAVTGLPVEQGSGGGMVGTATLMIDFEIHWFEDEDWRRFGVPRRGDRIEMLAERNAANRMAEITRVGDDGSARFYCWCSLVNVGAP
jgi:hypothetical protein